MTLCLNSGSHAPLHRQIESLLQTMVRSPSYQNGKLLPPEMQIARELGVSRNTVRAAIDRLVQRGLLIRKAGRGTRVASPGARTSRLESWESFTREMEALGVKVQTFSQSYGLRATPTAVADALGIRRGQRVYVLDRVRGYDGNRVVHFQSWFHPRLQLTGEEDFSRPLYEVLYDVSSVRPEQSQERITAIAATAALAKSLRVPVRSPLLQRRRRVTDVGDRAIEYAINHYCTAHFAYTINIRRAKP